MKLLFLGTSAGRPTLVRNVTSIALQLPDPHHRFWLFDVGEGTQHQLLRTKLKLNRLERIFITHMHGDHTYGLPGLLGSRTYYDGAGRLQIFGPPGIRSFIDHAMAASQLHLNYDLEITEVEEGRLPLEDDLFTVETAELHHRIRCFGYRISERPRPGRLDLAKLAQLGVPPGPLYGKLKLGEDIVLPSGETIRSVDVVGAPVPGRILTILGDTAPCEAAVRLAEDADLLVHEATFNAGLEEKAVAYGHSTIAQAAETAAQAKAKRLAVTHFSARYSEEDVERFAAENQSIFPNIVAARDYLELPF
ncbi:ribonuclease Z [Cohnella lubricantis]|uniref:Ribonuclease Z n=1 Tax=Cohnella lubricantis TaxID=2163172 RepID=A0A841TF59_9BACL|nr:ribonuclease Z [Cohnella lubricantis]MBB6677860.1 ribonuclease Z [Cohnella lubricantis]MBP2119039.1 ribonuclease Z [Cohnella lubricantis]